MKMGPVHLNVANRQWYRDVLGIDDERLLVLHENPHAPKPTGRAGLFHVALLYPSRPALGAALRRLIEHGWPLTGASDHQVSEALYLEDPGGVGIELYHDRPREEWGEMTTLPLDLGALLKDAAPFYSPPAQIGHVHLQALDLESSREFYVDGLGLDVMASRHGALFLAADGYHHHLGINRWNRPHLPASPDALGLRSFTLQLDPGLLERAALRLGGTRLLDPSGIGLELALAS